MFHNKENEISIDRNGDIRSFFPWPACKRLFEFTSESLHRVRERGWLWFLQTLTDEFMIVLFFQQ